MARLIADACGASVMDRWTGLTLATAPNATARARGWYKGKPLPKDAKAILAAGDWKAACVRYGWRVWTTADHEREAAIV